VRNGGRVIDKIIMLTGFMGSGKTTVGRLLADRLNRTFLDADQEIERQHGMPITEIFQSMGEAKFRQMERDYLLGLCRGEHQAIVSLGGGAFMQEAIRGACLDAAFVVFLDIGWDAWHERHHLLKDTRPLLQTKSMEEIRSLFEARRIVYKLSHFTVATDGLTPSEVTELVLREIRRDVPGGPG